jgi:hypothetical protein
MATKVSYAVRTIIASTLVASSGAAQPTDASPQLGPPGEGLPQAAPAPLSEPAADQPPADTLIKGKVKHGGYGAPAVKITAVNGEAAIMPGIQGGWVINHSFVIGAAGFGLATRQDAPIGMRVDGRPSTLEMGYGGLRLGYLVMPKSVVHLGFGLLIGGGGVAGLSKDELPVIHNGDLHYERRVDNSDAFFVTEPEIEVEINVADFMRVAVSGSYRFVAGIESTGLSSWDIAGPAGGVALRFGSF